MGVCDSVRAFREDKAPLFFFPFFEEDVRLSWACRTNASDYRRDKDSSSVHGHVFLSFGFFAVGKNRVLNIVKGSVKKGWAVLFWRRLM